MSRDAIFDALLTEAAGDRDFDVTHAVLQSAADEGTISGEVDAPAEPERAPAPEPEAKQGRLIAIVGWAAAACAVVAIGWILLSWETPAGTPDPAPIERTLPETVAVVGDYEYEGDVVRIKDGFAVVREGAPAVHVGSNSFINVKGVVLVRLGEAPDDAELTEYRNSLRSGGSLKPEELEMLKDSKWIMRGGVAICVLVGSVTLNGDIIEAQMVKRVAKKEAESVEDRADNLMNRWDKNDDGVITADESHEELMSLDDDESGEVTLEEVKNHFRKVDERRAAELKAKEEAEKKRNAEFEKKATEAGNKKADDFIGKLDKNDDGNVDADEAEGLGAEAEGWMKKLDGDKNGEISKEEAEDYFKKESLKEEKAAAEKKNSSGSNVGGMRRAVRTEGAEEPAHEGEHKEESNNKKK